MEAARSSTDFLPSLIPPSCTSIIMAAIYHLYLLNHDDSPIFKDTYTSSRFNAHADTTAPSQPQSASPTFNDMISALVGTNNKRTSLPAHAEQGGEVHQDVMDLVAHASLDVIEDVQTKSNNMCVGSVGGERDC